MARNVKSGLDYFPLDVDTDDKFELIEAKHELIGFAIIIKLFQRIYKAGYYLEWNDEKLLIFKKSINVDINTINDVINDCLKYGIFNEALFKKYKILTSSGIQKRYFQACERRKILNLHKEFIIVDINETNVNINWINDDKSTQRKEKKIKEKKSKENKIEIRKEKFKEDLKPFLEIYGKDLLNDFFLYWTEMNQGGKKMRFEMQTVFDIKRRLATWHKNSTKNNFTKQQTTTPLIADTSEVDKARRLQQEYLNSLKKHETLIN
jgi:hypothetical protein